MLRNYVSRHTALFTNEFLTDKNIPVVPQSPYLRKSVPVPYFYTTGSKTTWKGAILLLFIKCRRA
jgi:hypothetical protein